MKKIKDDLDERNVSFDKASGSALEGEGNRGYFHSKEEYFHGNTQRFHREELRFQGNGHHFHGNRKCFLGNNVEGEGNRAYPLGNIHERIGNSIHFHFISIFVENFHQDEFTKKLYQASRLLYRSHSISGNNQPGFCK